MKEITEFLPEPPYTRMSTNRLEALPGTPVYEYAKVLGLIGRTPEEEEKYLLYISDTDGGQYGKQLNFTDYPDFIVQSWPRLIWMENMHHWYKKHPKVLVSLLTTLWLSFLRLSGLKRVSNEAWGTAYMKKNLKDSSKGRDLIESFVDKDFNARRDELEESRIRLRYHPSLYGFMRRSIVLERIVMDFFSKDITKKLWFEKIVELLVYYVKGPKKEKFNNYKSMRGIIKEIKLEPLTESEKNLISLQLGR
jgi:hypothetical protein